MLLVLLPADEHRTMYTQHTQERLIWNSEPYLGYGVNRFGVEKNTEHFEVDLQTFFDEYAALLPRKKYDGYGIYGWQNKSAVKTSEVCERFIQALEAAGKDSTRAKLELDVALAFENFLLDSNIPAGSIFISFSPRGTQEEGYPGLEQENYVFINVYCKDTFGTATLYQFTSFASSEQLVLQHALLHDYAYAGKTQSAKVGTNGNKALNSIKQHNDVPNLEHYLISKPITVIKDDVIKDDALSANHSTTTQTDTRNSARKTSNETIEVFLEFINQTLYQDGTDFQGQSTWPIKIEDLPMLDVNEYKHISGIITQIAIGLLHEILALVDTDTISLQRAVYALDAAVAMYRSYLLKWVELNDLRTFTNNVSGITQKNPTHPGKVKSLPSIETITSAWRVKELEPYLPQYLAGLSVSLTADHITQGLAVTSQILLRLSSVAHCTAFAPFTTALQISNATTVSQAATTSLFAQGISAPGLGTGLGAGFGGFGTGGFSGGSASNSGTNGFFAGNRYAGRNSSEHSNFTANSFSYTEFTIALSDLPLPEHSKYVDALSNHAGLIKKLAKLKTLRSQLTPTTILNQETNQHETIFAWFTKPDLIPEYAQSCYRKTSGGEVFGPCDIELNKDNLLIALDQHTDMHFGNRSYLEISEQMSVAEHIFRLEMEVVSHILSHNFEPNTNHASSLSGNTITPEQKERFTTLTNRLCRRIFRVTLSDLVAGVTSYTDEFLQLPYKCITFIDNYGPNKFEALHSLSDILETDDVAQIALRLDYHHK